jgi:hypothetical protein
MVRSRAELLSPRLFEIDGPSGYTAAVNPRNGTRAKTTRPTAAQ